MAVSEDFKIGDKVRVFDRRSMYYDKIGTIVKVIGKEFVCINLEVPYVDFERPSYTLKSPMG